MGHPRKACTLDAGRLRTRRHGPKLTTRQRGPRCKAKRPRCKAKNGVGTASSHPIRHLCCLFSNLSTLALQLCMPLNSVFRRLLPVSPAFHPLSLRQSPTNAPSSNSLHPPFLASVLLLRFIRQTYCPLPRPVSCPHIDPTFIVLSADLAHINIAIARRPSHPPQRHACPLTSRRQP